MGSAGPLLSHPPPQLQLGSVLLRRIPRPRVLPPLLPSAAAAPGPLRGRRRRLRCSTFDGDGGPREPGSPPHREESPSSGIGAALEDPPPGPVENRSLGGLSQEEQSALYNFLYPSKELLPDDKEMSIFDHLEELRERIFISVLAVGAAILGCFAFSKDLILLLEAPVSVQGVRFLQLSPGEFFFTTLKVSGYCGLLLGSPVILYEIIAFVLPGLTREERKFLGPIVLGSSILFYLGIFFSYTVLSPAALNFFVNYADGAVESLWSIDQYFEFILILMFSTGLSFQVPVIQLLLGQIGLVSSDQMLSIWRYVVVGAVVAAAVLTPSTDPFTQMLLAGPLLGLYLGGAWMVKLIGR
ncbi:sec-independent protein translocase protein TATC, chloroplastic-like [Phragmites australis]|uniref:sec-independent protein translocase protein TATC, chloroplastic-like n=1 Tax=Phragmites australis TaxID=29695 RepID=UPI002D79922E|nr:sec-independent protein translocase protein TATC, chloroplastic-like [Phragmites australis]